MSAMPSSLLAFALPLLVGRALDFALGTRWGKEVVTSTGNASLASPEGRRLVRRYSGAAAAAAAALAFILGHFCGERRERKSDRAKTTAYAAELLLAVGALLKIASDYLKDRRAMEGRPA